MSGVCVDQVWKGSSYKVICDDWATIGAHLHARNSTRDSGSGVYFLKGTQVMILDLVSDKEGRNRNKLITRSSYNLVLI